MSRPELTFHYADGRPSETREMTEEEHEQYLATIAVTPKAPRDADNDN